jgi:hypothetical protein
LSIKGKVLAVRPDFLVPAPNSPQALATATLPEVNNQMMMRMYVATASGRWGPVVERSTVLGPVCEGVYLLGLLSMELWGSLVKLL